MSHLKRRVQTQIGKKIGKSKKWRKNHVGKKEEEFDFVLEKGDGTVLPIEVKSGKDYAFHLALNNILSNEEYNIPEAIVLCNDADDN